MYVGICCVFAPPPTTESLRDKHVVLPNCLKGVSPHFATVSCGDDLRMSTGYPGLCGHLSSLYFHHSMNDTNDSGSLAISLVLAFVQHHDFMFYALQYLVPRFVSNVTSMSLVPFLGHGRMPAPAKTLYGIPFL